MTGGLRDGFRRRAGLHGIRCASARPKPRFRAGRCRSGCERPEPGRSPHRATGGALFPMGWVAVLRSSVASFSSRVRSGVVRASCVRSDEGCSGTCARCRVPCCRSLRAARLVAEKVELQVECGAVFVLPRLCSSEPEKSGTVGGSEEDLGRDVDVGGYRHSSCPIPVVDAEVAQIDLPETGIGAAVSVLFPCRIQPVPYGETAEMQVLAQCDVDCGARFVGRGAIMAGSHMGKPCRAFASSAIPRLSR